MTYRDHAGAALVPQPPTLQDLIEGALSKTYIRWLLILLAAVICALPPYEVSAAQVALGWCLLTLVPSIALGVAAMRQNQSPVWFLWVMLPVFVSVSYSSHSMDVRRTALGAPPTVRLPVPHLPPPPDPRAHHIIPFGSVVTRPDGRSFMVIVGGATLSAPVRQDVWMRCRRADDSIPLVDEDVCRDCRDAR